LRICPAISEFADDCALVDLVHRWLRRHLQQKTQIANSPQWRLISVKWHRTLAVRDENTPLWWSSITNPDDRSVCLFLTKSQQIATLQRLDAHHWHWRGTGGINVDHQHIFLEKQNGSADALTNHIAGTDRSSNAVARAGM